MTEPPALPARARVVIIGGGVIGASVAYHLAQPGLDRRAAARAGAAVLRHHLARGRPGRPAARLGERHPAGPVLHRALRPARGRDRPGHRLPALRRRHRRPDRGPDDPAAADGRHRRGLRAGVRADQPAAGPRALPDHGDRRPRGRDLAARRRQGQPDRPDRRAGPGARGRASRSGSAPGSPASSPKTARSPASAPTTATSRPRSWSTAPASGPRRSARWPGSPCRCTRPSTSTWSPSRSTACTGTSRSCATRTATPTSRRRSAAWWSAASSPTPSPGSPPTSCPTRSSSSCWTRTGTTSRSSWRARSTRIPALAETGIKKFYNGPESFTPDNQFILGEAPELRNFFVGAGFNSVGIASAGGAGRALAEWIVERRAGPGPVRGRHPALRPRSTATTSGCTTGSARSSACTTPCRGRTAS